MPLATPRFIAELEEDLALRDAAGLRRVRRTIETPQGVHLRVDGRPVLAFASNDYLGLASDPAVIAAMRDGVATHGAGAGASHLIAGHFAVHAALETALARFVAPCPDARALTFSSGYLANLAVVTALAGRHDAVFADRLNHASLNDAVLLSRAAFVRYPHRDLAVLERQLAASTARRKLIATDAVFSMDGTIAPLPELLALAERFDAVLVLDDAHGFGVLGRGRGSAAACGVAAERLIVMGTLGKAAGIAGAFVAAHRVVIDALVQTARPYVYTTAAPPALAAGLLQALALIEAGAHRRAHLDTLVARLRARTAALPWRLAPSPTAIQPLLIGDNRAALAVSAALWEHGIWVPAIRPPTVPVGTARLRISLSAAHAEQHVDRLATALAAIAQQHASAGPALAGTLP